MIIKQSNNFKGEIKMENNIIELLKTRHIKENCSPLILEKRHSA